MARIRDKSIVNWIEADRAVHDMMVMNTLAQGSRRPETWPQGPDTAGGCRAREHVSNDQVQAGRTLTSTQDDNLDFLDILGPRLRKAVEKKAGRISIPAGQLLFEQGEPSDALYILVTGFLGVYALDGEGSEVLVETIRPGETAGEMGVVAGVPRMATVRAVRDS